MSEEANAIEVKSVTAKITKTDAASGRVIEIITITDGEITNIEKFSEGGN